MPKPAADRLSGGEYVIPDASYNQEISGARGLLMEATLQTLPKVFDELATKVSPLYAKRVSVGPATAQREAENAFQSSFEEWAGKFHIEEEWLLDLAKKILDHWLKNPEALERRTWLFVELGTGSSFVESNPFELELEGWDQLNCSWAQYKKYVSGELDRLLKEYEKLGREFAINAGWIPARHKYSVSNFHWFVLYQFAGKNCQQIFDERKKYPQYPAKTVSTIKKGVLIAKELLNWENLRVIP